MASYTKLKTGWQYRISYKDTDGKYRTKSKNGFRTKGEAQQAAHRMEEALKGDSEQRGDIPFPQYMEDWYRTFKKGKHSSVNDESIKLSIFWVKKYFKNTKIKEVTRHDYQSFLNWYGDGRATGSVKKIHTYAKACLLDAREAKHIEHNPTYRIIPKGTKSAKKDEEKYLSYEDTQKLLTEVYRDIKPEWHSRYMIVIALATGMRFSEILALSWENIDFNLQTIRVNKTFDYRITQKFKTTKSGKPRLIVIDNETLEFLHDFRNNNNAKYKKHLFIEKTDVGYSYTTNNAVNKALRKACKRANVNPITFHSLRHTHCSLLIYSGLNIKYISKRLGHASTDITYNVYGHIIDELEYKESDKLTKFMSELNKNAK